MPEDGSPRPRLLRRLSLAIARAVALLILVGGFAGVLALAAPRLETLPRYVSALLLGVVIFESLRPREKRVVIETPAPAEAAPVVVPVDTREADAHIARLKSDIEDLVEINDALRQQTERAESSVGQLNDELEKLRTQTATEADQGRARE